MDQYRTESKKQERKKKQDMEKKLAEVKKQTEKLKMELASLKDGTYRDEDDYDSGEGEDDSEYDSEEDEEERMVRLAKKRAKLGTGPALADKLTQAEENLAKTQEEEKQQKEKLDAIQEEYASKTAERDTLDQ